MKRGDSPGQRCAILLATLLLLTHQLSACQADPGVEPTPQSVIPETSTSTPQLPETISKEEKEEEEAYPQATAVLWANGFLWTANQSGLLTRWDVNSWDYRQYRLPGEPVISALASDGESLYAGTHTGDIWQLAEDESQVQVVKGGSGWVSAMALDSDENLWYADVSHPTQPHTGRGLVQRDSAGEEWTYHLAEGDSLKTIAALAFDPKRESLWIGTRSAGIFLFYVNKNGWQSYTTANSNLADNSINHLQLAPDGSLWVATSSGVSALKNGRWQNHNLADEEALSLAVSVDGVVWVAGRHYIAWKSPNQTWHVYTAADNPLLSDRSRFVVLDDHDRPWFVGRRGKLHFDGGSWMAYDADVRRFARFVPVEPPTEIIPPPADFPSPTEDYIAWLQTWPRPIADNGRGLHFLQTHQFDAIEAQKQINRLQELGVHWTVVIYTDHQQLTRIAPLFQAADITVVWRPFLRPYESYASWAADVEFLRSRGIAPYLQLYNEPSLAQEWDGAPPDPQTYLDNLLPAAREVYEAGGYIGLQHVDPDWLRLTLQHIKTQGADELLDRLFFVPHLYGLNHPPPYDEDINSVLGFGEYAAVFEEEIGFVPAMIVGEGGWRPGEGQDNRYPPVDETRHRDYHLAVFDWFGSGQLSNGEGLPDYLFAFCPWLIADPNDPAAWFDGPTGERTLTIEAVTSAPSFTRRFSWDATP